MAMDEVLAEGHPRPDVGGHQRWYAALHDMEQHPEARYTRCADKHEFTHRVRHGIFEFYAKVTWETCGIRYSLDAPNQWWSRLPDATETP